MQTSESWWFLYNRTHETVGTHTHHNCGGSGALRKCAHSHILMKVRTKVFTLEGAPQRCPYYTYGQVEPLVLLNLITNEDRYFRVSFPGNRPRDSAASAYFICVREPTPFTTLSVPFVCPFVCSYPSLSPLLRVPSLSFIVILK